MPADPTEYNIPVTSEEALQGAALLKAYCQVITEFPKEGDLRVYLQSLGEESKDKLAALTHEELLDLTWRSLKKFKHLLGKNFPPHRDQRG